MALYSCLCSYSSGSLLKRNCRPYYLLCNPAFHNFYLSFLPGALNHFSKYGDFSYGIYIYAYPVQQTLIFFLGPEIGLPLMVFLSFICTLPLAVLSWYVIEKKALAFKNAVN